MKWNVFTNKVNIITWNVYKIWANFLEPANPPTYPIWSTILKIKKGMSLFHFKDSTVNCGSITILNSFFFATLVPTSVTKSL